MVRRVGLILRSAGASRDGRYRYASAAWRLPRHARRAAAGPGKVPGPRRAEQCFSSAAVALGLAVGHSVGRRTRCGLPQRPRCGGPARARSTELRRVYGGTAPEPRKDTARESALGVRQTGAIPRGGSRIRYPSRACAAGHIARDGV